MEKLQRRFWSKVVSRNDGECWEWDGSLIDGYGQMRTSKLEVQRAHRISYEMSNGHIPEGKCVMHTCDNRRCVNPAHLRVGTRDDNNKDRKRKGRSATGENNGQSKLTEDQVREIRNNPGRLSARKLGAVYGVSHTAVLHARKGINWASLT